MNEKYGKFQPLLDADAAGGGSGSEGGTETTNEQTEGKTMTFESWQEAMTDEQKSLIAGHIKGLKSALDSERESRKSLEKQLRDLAKSAEKGSEAQNQLTKLADDLQAADRKAEFYEAAHGAGVKNLKLAYMVATNDELFDKHGRADFVEMKKLFPELFGTSNPTRGDAGSGTEKKTKPSGGMNDFIRSAAGR
jgi:hypothetical protein